VKISAKPVGYLRLPLNATRAVIPRHLTGYIGTFGETPVKAPMDVIITGKVALIVTTRTESRSNFSQ
jgi:hypothetical protein